MFRKYLLGMVPFAALSVLLGACADIEPGDYVVYRIAFEQEEQSADCFPGGQIPVDVSGDSSSNFVPGTWILYMGADELPYLDIGSITMRGEEEGDGFAFKGESVDVNIQDDGMGGQITTTVTMTTAVQFNISGAVVEGTFEERTRNECNGAGCPENTSCTTKSNFVGGEVEDVELQHDV